jgi:hypothetical protein
MRKRVEGKLTIAKSSDSDPIGEYMAKMDVRRWLGKAKTDVLGSVGHFKCAGSA